MSTNEIYARIAYAITDIENATFGIRDVTIGMTQELFNKLFPNHFILKEDCAIATLFGCKVRVIPCSGLWWIVGFEGTAEGEKHDG